MKIKIAELENDKEKMRKSAIESLVDKEKLIIDLKGKIDKSEKFYKGQLEKCQTEIDDLKEKVELYESDDYYLYLEEEIMANYEDEKNEMQEEIENLNQRIDEYDKQLYFYLINN